MRSFVRRFVFVLGLVAAPAFPSLAQPAAASSQVFDGCIVDSTPGSLLVKISDGETVTFDLSRFGNRNYDSLARDECYQLEADRQGSTLFLMSLSRPEAGQQKSGGKDEGGGNDQSEGQ